jgi:hypothetical protein
MPADDQTGPTWEQFGLQHNWGIQGNQPRKESKKAKKKRMKGTAPKAKKKKNTTPSYRDYHQLSLDGENITISDAEVFGDAMKKKPPYTARLGFHNIQLLPENSRHYKSRQLVDHISNAELDALLMNKVGINWDKISADNQWVERTIGKLAHNTTEQGMTDTIQYGGVGIVATQELAHRIIDRGRDPTNLGRWVWIRIQGKEGHTVRIATAYRPWESPGASTVYHQQARGLSANGDHRNPIDALMEDLQKAIKDWKAAGDHIVIGMDANEDVRKGTVHDTFAALGLREAILEKHHDQSPPATQNRNTKRQPIDGIWVSSSLKISAGGYLPFGDACPSDHRMLMIEIQYSVAFGQRPQEIDKLKPKRLKTSDPRLVKKYNLRVKKAMRDTGFRKKYELHKTQADNGIWNDTMLEQYDNLDQEDRALRDTVELGIRKLNMGGVPWSPKLQPFRDTIELWKMIRRKRKGSKISVKRIRRFMLKTRIRDALTNDLEQAEILLQQACQSYKVASKSALVWRNDFLHELAAAKAEKNGTDAEKEWKSLIHIEKQR